MASWPICPYCQRASLLVTGRAIYPRARNPELTGKHFYQCQPCDAYVGCHQGTTQPLGSLANAALREARKAAHAAFDPLWKSTRMTRKDAYKWLSEQLGIHRTDTHIGLFDEETCRRVVQAVSELDPA